MLGLNGSVASVGSGVSGTQTGYTGGYLTLPAWTLSRWTSGSSADGTTLTALPDDGNTCTARSDNQGSNCAEGNIITITGTITGLTGAWNVGLNLAYSDGCDILINCNEDLWFDETINKFIDFISLDNDVNVVYVGYTKSGGKSGNAERLPEEQAKVLMTLKDDINTMLGNRGNAEDLAFEIEEGLKRKQA